MLLIEDDPRIDPSTLWKELIVSSTVGAAWLFALLGGPLCERFGRKPVILVASVVFAVGAVVMGAAESKEVLLVGRLVVGAGIGFASMAVPIYISEAAPPGNGKVKKS
jgi:SP family myo-inositol transporter-like MFS transporter 13